MRWAGVMKRINAGRGASRITAAISRAGGVTSITGPAIWASKYSPEFSESARDDGRRSAEDLGDDGHLPVVGLLLGVRERALVALVGRERDVDQRRVDPQHQLRIGRRVRRARREGPELRRRPAAHPRMRGPHGCSDRVGLGLAPVGNQVERPERAQQPAPEVAPIVGVLRDAGGNQRMRDLQQHGSAPAEERRDRGVAHHPDDALRREVAVAARHALCVAQLALRPVRACRGHRDVTSLLLSWCWWRAGEER